MLKASKRFVFNWTIVIAISGIIWFIIVPDPHRFTRTWIEFVGIIVLLIMGTGTMGLLDEEKKADLIGKMLVGGAIGFLYGVIFPGFFGYSITLLGGFIFAFGWVLPLTERTDYYKGGL